MGAEILAAILPAAITGGAGLGGAKLAADVQEKSAKIQAEFGQKALDEAKRQYELERSDLAGYRGLGQGAVGNLAYLSGITMPTGSTGGPMSGSPGGSTPAPYIVPGAVDAKGKPYPGRATEPDVQDATLAQQGRTSGPVTVTQQRLPGRLGYVTKPRMVDSGYVNMRSPSGQIVRVPSAKVAEAQTQGGVIV